MKTKALKYLGLAALLALVSGACKVWAANPVDGSITVTPVANVSLALPTTFYAFGNVPVNTSTTSMSALALNNVGNVGVTVQKQVFSQSIPAGWTVAASSATDQYTLYCATAAAAIAMGSYSANTKFLTEGVYNNLTDAAGAGNSIPVSGGVNLWFRLDMPTAVGSQLARTITIRFNAAAQ